MTVEKRTPGSGLTVAVSLTSCCDQHVDGWTQHRQQNQNTPDSSMAWHRGGNRRPRAGPTRCRGAGSPGRRRNTSPTMHKGHLPAASPVPDYPSQRAGSSEARSGSSQPDVHRRKRGGPAARWRLRSHGEARRGCPAPTPASLCRCSGSAGTSTRTDLLPVGRRPARGRPTGPGLPGAP